jgi:hypothetical protein
VNGSSTLRSCGAMRRFSATQLEAVGATTTYSVALWA